MNYESIGPPNIFFSEGIFKVGLENGVNAWAFGSDQYIRWTVDNVKSKLKEKNIKLPVKCETPIADFIVAYCSAHKLGKWKIVEVDVGANHGTVYFGL